MSLKRIFDNYKKSTLLKKFKFVGLSIYLLSIPFLNYIQIHLFGYGSLGEFFTACSKNNNLKQWAVMQIFFYLLFTYFWIKDVRSLNNTNV